MMFHTVFRTGPSPRRLEKSGDQVFVSLNPRLSPSCNGTLQSAHGSIKDYSFFILFLQLFPIGGYQITAETAAFHLIYNNGFHPHRFPSSCTNSVTKPMLPFNYVHACSQ